MLDIKPVAAALCLGFTAVHAAPVVQLSPGGSSAVTAGTTLSVGVEVANLAGDIVSAYDLNVKYDSSLLTNPSVIFGTLLGNASAFEVLESGTGTDTAPGLVDFAAVSLLSDATLLALQAPNATVTLATLSFDVLTNGVASLDIVFGPNDDVKCADAVQCISGTGVPEPGAIALLLTALLGCGATTRASASRRCAP